MAVFVWIRAGHLPRGRTPDLPGEHTGYCSSVVLRGRRLDRGAPPSAAAGSCPEAPFFQELLDSIRAGIRISSMVQNKSELCADRCQGLRKASRRVRGCRFARAQASSSKPEWPP